MGDTDNLLETTTNTYQQFRDVLDQGGQDYNQNHPWSIKIGEKLDITSYCTSELAYTCVEEPLEEHEHYYIARRIIKPYRELHHSYKMKSSTTTHFYEQKEVTNTTTNTYNEYYALSQQEVTTGDGVRNTSVYTYPYDAIADFGTLDTDAQAAITLLDQTNQIASPILTKRYQQQADTQQLLSTSRTDYKNWGTNALGQSLLLPEKIMVAKGDDELQERVGYHQYDTVGNPVKISQTDGTPTYYIWGYQGQYPIAKIENFPNLPSGIQEFIDTAVAASNADDDRTLGTEGNEGALRTALAALRNYSALQDALVSTATFDPLVGVTSMTDARGYTTYYHYDELNRLETIKDADGHLISENEYHYKN